LDRRDLIRKYKETPRPADIYRVRNTINGRSVVGASLNLPGMFNRIRFQLEHGSHPDGELARIRGRCLHLRGPGPIGAIE
jgi:hypothetical protein